MARPKVPSDSRWAVDALMVLLLVSAVTGLFTGVFHLDSSSGQTPLFFSGDALWTQASILQCAEAGLDCLVSSANPRLGAPGVADWADFPRTEKLWWWLGGLLARRFGLGWGTNLLFLGAALGAALSMYAAARHLRAHPALAAASALLFAFSPYLFTRNIHHLGLTLYLAVPLAILIWRRLAQPRAPTGSARAVLVVGAAFMGAQMVYYAVYFLIGLAVIGVLQALARRAAVARWCALSAAVTTAVMLLGTQDTLVLAAREGRNPQAVVRDPRDAFHFGLWPEQLVIPSGAHRWGPVRSLVPHYATKFGSRGEYPSPYLGLFGALSLAALLATFARRQLRRAWGRSRISPRPLGARWSSAAKALWQSPTSRSAGLVLFWVAMTLPWGVLALFGRLTGVAVLRSNNRISIVLLAVALLWLAHRLSRFTARRGGSLAPWLAGAAVASLGLSEQMPYTDEELDPSHLGRLAQAVGGAREVARELERDADSPSLFVYPSQRFPEDLHPPFGDDYLPFQLSNASVRARWSFGGVAGRRSGDWPAEVAGLPAEDFAASLREAGFTGLVTHRAACDAATCLPRLADVVSRFPGARAVEVPGCDWLGWTWALPTTTERPEASTDREPPRRGP